MPAAKKQINRIKITRISTARAYFDAVAPDFRRCVSVCVAKNAYLCAKISAR